MPAAVSTNQFFETLKKSNLLHAKQVAHLRAIAVQSGADSDPEQLAAALVKRGLITRWQAQKILRGRFQFFLGRYKLLERIGSGGMGAVFKAQHTTVGHTVALKVISRDKLQQPAMIQRFNREIKAAAALNHPNIIKAFDADQVGDTHFLVMEYVDGRDLNVWLKKFSRLPVDWSCEVIKQAAKGLQHAHEQGLVHRDIKPANLLVSKDPLSGLPQLKLLDLGLARFVTETDRTGDITETGQILGTPDYISPEQARATKTADIRADIFSLGCTLFRMLTGRLPFLGDNPVEKLVARYTEQAPPVRSLRPDIPPELEAVVAKMMATDADDRYPTPQEVVAALTPFSLSRQSMEPDPTTELLTDVARAAANDAEAMDDPASSATGEFLNLLAGMQAETDTPHMSGETADSLPATALAEPTSGRGNMLVWLEQKFYQVPLWGRVAMIGSVVALSLITGMLIKQLWVSSGRARINIAWSAADRGQGEMYVDSRQLTVPPNGPIEINGPYGLRQIVLKRPGYEDYEFQQYLARGAVEQVVPEWIPTPETAARLRAQKDEQLRRQELAALQQRAARLQLAGTPAQVAEIRRDLQAFIARWKGTPESDNAQLELARFVPLNKLDPERIPNELAGLRDTLPLVGVFGSGGGGSYRHESPITTVVYSDDGRRIATASQNEIKVWEANSGALLCHIEPEYRTTNLAFSPDGGLLATLGYLAARQVTQIWDVDTSRPLHGLEPKSRTYRMSFLPNSPATLALGNIDGTVEFWNARTGKLLRALKAHNTAVSILAVGGEQMVTVGFRGRIRRGPSADHVIKVWAATGDEPVATLPAPESQVFGMALSPDGNLLATVSMQDKVIRIVDLKTRKVHSEINTGGMRVYGLAFTHDGKTLAGGTPVGRTIRLWNVADGNELATIEGANGFINSFSLSPDGQIAFCSFNSYRLRIYDWQEDREINAAGGHQLPVTSLGFSPDGGTLASVGQDTQVILWNAVTAEGRPLTQAPPAYAALFSPDGKTLAVAATNGQLWLKDMTSNATPRQLSGLFVQPGYPVAWAFMPDGKLAAAWRSPAAGGKIEPAVGLINVSTAKLERTYPLTGLVSALAAHPDGESLAAAQFNLPVKLLNLQTGESKDIVTGAGTVRHLAFSPNGKRLVSADDEGMVKIWAVDRRMLTSQIEERTIALLFDGDEKFVTCNPDGELKRWDVRSGTEVSRLTLPDFLDVSTGKAAQPAHSLAVSPDGDYLATGNASGTIFILKPE